MEIDRRESLVSDAAWAIISKHGVVHRLDEKRCTAIKLATQGKQRIQEINVKQVVVYHLPPCHSCWPTPGSFAASMKEAMSNGRT